MLWMFFFHYKFFLVYFLVCTCRVTWRFLISARNEIVSQTNSPLVFSFLQWKTYVKFVPVSISSHIFCRYLSIILNLKKYFIQPHKFI